MCDCRTFLKANKYRNLNGIRWACFQSLEIHDKYKFSKTPYNLLLVLVLFEVCRPPTQSVPSWLELELAPAKKFKLG